MTSFLKLWKTEYAQAEANRRQMEDRSNLKIAVVGAGVAGIVSAYLLQERHQVTLFEKNDYIGGHTHTIVVETGPDKGLPVDTGFIVFNDRTYPHFIRFLERLKVSYQKAPMSFSYYDPRSGFVYGSNNLFADRRNLVSPRFLKFLLDITRFNRIANRLLKEEELPMMTLGEFLEHHRFSRNLIDWYVIPMGAAIWSTPDLGMMKFPAATFLRFFANHGLLTINDQPQWYTVQGGSHEYVKAFLKSFKGTVNKDGGAQSIRRTETGAQVKADNTWQDFDRVVVAAHADEALKLLEDPSEEETRLLSPWGYTQNRVILHTDSSVLPPNRKALSAWNYVRSGDIANSTVMTMSYSMNLLQNLNTTKDYCVTLNPGVTIDPETIIAELVYTHPTFTNDAVATQAELPELNGVRQTYFCGSYFRYGFHEDATLSAVNVGKSFGIEL